MEHVIRHFIRVAEYGKGSIFGLGEELEERIIIASTDVQCLLVPRYWLFLKQQNVGNVWNRTRLFLESNIPSRACLFQELKRNRQWNRFKAKLIEETPKRILNRTAAKSIPLMCRIESGL